MYNLLEIQRVHPKGDQSWVFTGRTDAEAETPILWPPHVKSWLIGKDPDAGRDWGQEGEGDDRGWDGWMASLTQWTWFGWTPGVGVEHWVLVCCNSWGHQELDMTEQLNWTDFLITDRSKKRSQEYQKIFITKWKLG